MKDARPFVIPRAQLPPGFAERVESPPVPPAEARPAATVVLLREPAVVGPPDGKIAPAAGRSHGGGGQCAPEVLLLRRHRASGFVPGAYVFPGGAVDEADATLAAEATSPGSEPDPPPAYRVAAVREVFEETGVLLATDASGRPVPDAASEPRLARWRELLLSGRATFAELLRTDGLVPALGELVCCAHWITPLAEPRRFDTRFFLARLPAGRQVVADAREMTDAVWLTPAEALHRFELGSLPMVFPTVKMLEALAGYAGVDAVLEAFQGALVQPVLPRLVRTADGVGIVVD